MIDFWISTNNRNFKLLKNRSKLRISWEIVRSSFWSTNDVNANVFWINVNISSMRNSLFADGRVDRLSECRERCQSSKSIEENRCGNSTNDDIEKFVSTFSSFSISTTNFSSIAAARLDKSFDEFSSSRSRRKSSKFEKFVWNSLSRSLILFNVDFRTKSTGRNWRKSIKFFKTFSTAGCRATRKIFNEFLKSSSNCSLYNESKTFDLQNLRGEM